MRRNNPRIFPRVSSSLSASEGKREPIRRIDARELMRKVQAELLAWVDDSANCREIDARGWAS